MDTNGMIGIGKDALMGTYAQYPVVLAGGEGRRVRDLAGKTYLDLVAGIAVNILGYHDPGLSAALHGVIDGGLLHCSNLYWNPYAIRAAERLKRLSSLSRVFFCNSGTEANEAALKLVRKYGASKAEGRTEVITMQQSFHGRTYGALSATGQPKYQEPFKPMLGGFSYAPFNDIEGVKALIGPKTCAIFVEAVQGEGGVIPATTTFLRQLRTLCDDHDILLVCDEVQCGMGRTGYPFAFQKSGISCDVMTLAKGLGGGVPIGATLVAEKLAHVLVPGDHGATFGGNLLACAAADHVLSRLEEGELIEHVRKVSAHLVKRLQEMQSEFPKIEEIRGEGLMLGIRMTDPVRPLIEACMDEGLLIANAGAHVLRMVPPLTITVDEIDEAIMILRKVFSSAFS